MGHALEHATANNNIKDLTVNFNKELLGLIGNYKLDIIQTKDNLLDNTGLATLPDAVADIPNHYSDSDGASIEATYNHAIQIVSAINGLGDIGTVDSMSNQELSDLLDNLKTLLLRTKNAQAEIVEI